MLLEGEGLEPGEQAEVQAWAAALEEDSAALQARQSSHLEASCSEGRSRAEKLTSLTIEALRSTVTAFFHAMPKACANCGAEVPDLKRSACSPTVASVGVSKASSLAWQGHSQLLASCIAAMASSHVHVAHAPKIALLRVDNVTHGYLPQADITGAQHVD